MGVWDPVPPPPPGPAVMEREVEGVKVGCLDTVMVTVEVGDAVMAGVGVG